MYKSLNFWNSSFIACIYGCFLAMTFWDTLWNKLISVLVLYWKLPFVAVYFIWHYCIMMARNDILARKTSKISSTFFQREEISPETGNQFLATMIAQRQVTQNIYDYIHRWTRMNDKSREENTYPQKQLQHRGNKWRPQKVLNNVHNICLWPIKSEYSGLSLRKRSKNRPEG